MYQRHSFRKCSQKRPILFLVLLFFLFLVELGSSYSRHWFSLPFSIHFIPKYLVLTPGERYTLKLNGISLRASYHSSDPLNAAVTETGVLYAVSCGQTTVTATIQNRKNKKVTCHVLVTKLNKEKLTLPIGQRYHLKLKGVWSRVSYRSNDSSIVSVSRFGWLKAKKTGTAIITVTCHNRSFTCTVTVP